MRIREFTLTGNRNNSSAFESASFQVTGLFLFNDMNLLTLLKLMNEYLQRTENKTLEEKLNELKGK